MCRDVKVNTKNIFFGKTKGGNLKNAKRRKNIKNNGILKKVWASIFF